MKTLTRKRESHLSRVEEADTTETEKVIELLGWTWDQYCQYHFEQFDAFIKQKCMGFPRITKSLRYSAIFRGFWNNELMTRNQTDFLPFATELTREEWHVNELGVLIHLKALPFGDPHIIEEFEYINSYQRLMIDEQFLNRCDSILKLIKHKEYKD